MKKDYFDVNKFMEEQTVLDKYKEWEFSRPKPHIILKNGVRLSLLGNNHGFCTPQSNRPPYINIEIGFISEMDTYEYKEFAEIFKPFMDESLGWLFYYVPVEQIEEYINRIGFEKIVKTLENPRI